MPAIFHDEMSFTGQFFTLKPTCHLEGPQAGSPGAAESALAQPFLEDNTGSSYEHSLLLCHQQI